MVEGPRVAWKLRKEKEKIIKRGKDDPTPYFFLSFIFVFLCVYLNMVLYLPQSAWLLHLFVLVLELVVILQLLMISSLLHISIDFNWLSRKGQCFCKMWRGQCKILWRGVGWPFYTRELGGGIQKKWGGGVHALSRSHLAPTWPSPPPFAQLLSTSLPPSQAAIRSRAAIVHHRPSQSLYP